MSATDNNNRILRKISELHDLSRNDLLKILTGKKIQASKTLIDDWFRAPDSPQFRSVNFDYLMAILQALIVKKTKYSV